LLSLHDLQELVNAFDFSHGAIPETANGTMDYFWIRINKILTVVPMNFLHKHFIAFASFILWNGKLYQNW
jgi:hypothetical protein